MLVARRPFAPGIAADDLVTSEVVGGVGNLGMPRTAGSHRTVTPGRRRGDRTEAPLVLRPVSRKPIDGATCIG
jgi:hypothetical protein